MDLSVIIVNYNTINLLKKCVDSVKETFPEGEIIVVDNASGDGSREEIPKMGIKYVLLEENAGFSKANNIGLEQAMGENILFLNPDTVVHEHTLKRCLEFLKANKE